MFLLQTPAFSGYYSSLKDLIGFLSIWFWSASGPTVTFTVLLKMCRSWLEPIRLAFPMTILFSSFQDPGWWEKSAPRMLQLPEREEASGKLCQLLSPTWKWRMSLLLTFYWLKQGLKPYFTSSGQQRAGSSMQSAESASISVLSCCNLMNM